MYMLRQSKLYVERRVKKIERDPQTRNRTNGSRQNVTMYFVGLYC